MTVPETRTVPLFVSAVPAAMRSAWPVTPSSAPAATVTFCKVAIPMFTAPPPWPRSTVPSSHEPHFTMRSPPSATILPPPRMLLSVPPTSRGIMTENVPPPRALVIVPPVFCTSGRFTLTVPPWITRTVPVLKSSPSIRSTPPTAPSPSTTPRFSSSE